jgi:hypothetical protein
MKNLKLLAVWLLFSSIAAQCYCQGQSLGSDDVGGRFEKSLKVEIKLVQTEVRSKETLTVLTAIYNTGKTEQTVAIWSCAFPEQWQTDNAAVLVDQVDCDWNKVSKIRLKPGEGFQFPKLSVHIELSDDPVSRIETSFRLGFRNADPSTTVGVDVKSPTLWSNTVAVSVLGKS